MGYRKNQLVEETTRMKNNKKRTNVNTNRGVASVDARKQSRNNNINSRIGKKVIPSTKKRPDEKKKGLIISSERSPVRKTVDPSQIVITKTFTREAQKNIRKQLKKQQNIKREPQKQKQQSPPLQQQYLEKSRIVLLCNLDPRATAKDIGNTCAMFGPIISCDLLVDPMGRPLYEAEIEFVYSNSAEKCVANLDKKYADGRMLRARLQTSATLPVKPRYSSKTVIASARVASEGFHDSNPSQYVNQPQPQQITRQLDYPYYQQQFYNKRY